MCQPESSWSINEWTDVASIATAAALLISALVFAFQLASVVRDRNARHRYLAERVSCWVEDVHRPNKDGILERHSVVHAKNVGDQPVFEVRIVIGQGRLTEKIQRIGTIEAQHVSVLAPDTQEDWMISALLDSHEIAAPLHVEATFRDPAEVWWRREFNGTLTEIKNRPRLVTADSSSDISDGLEQIGKQTTFNPICVATSFYTLVTGEDVTSAKNELIELCTTESPLKEDDFETARSVLLNRGMASFPEYPTEGVAYVKFPPDPKVHQIAQGTVLIEAVIMTLLKREKGWKVHDVGIPKPISTLPISVTSLA